MKKLIKCLIWTIFIFIILFVINYARINIYYFINKDNYTEYSKIEGNIDNYAPQGLAYSEKYNVILQTSYNKNKKASMLYITDFKTKKLIKKLQLKKSNNEINNNHVGGIATDNNTLWITSDYEVNEYSLEEVMNTNNNYIKSISDKKIPNRGDFCTYKDNTLWIGSFHIKIFYPEDPILHGFKVNNDNIDYDNPDYEYDIPWLVQGMAITDDNKFVYSQSFTPFHLSTISIYDREKLVKEIKVPPMSEGIFYKDNEIYICFESNATRYFYADPKIKKILKIKIN